MTYGTFGTLDYLGRTFAVKGEILNMFVNPNRMKTTMNKVVEWASKHDVFEVADISQINIVNNEMLQCRPNQNLNNLDGIELLQCRIHHGMDDLTHDLEYDVEFIDFTFDPILLLLHIEIQIFN